ncbi:hypothetical protein [Pedobacter yulinensis]|nr:hypothetical protein [Pedobacter yulinensis]
MTKKDFRDNLLKAVAEIDPGIAEYSFMITPVPEQHVKYNSTDDRIRLWMMTEKNTKNRQFTLDGAVDFLVQPNDRYPLWVRLNLVESDGRKALIELKTSMRFRTPSQLKDNGKGYPPFAVGEGA